MGTILSIRSLNKSFDTFSVIEDFSLSVEANEIVCILGASGCGKTTLLNIIAGLETTQNDTIDTQFKRPGKDIGYMMQHNPLLPWRSVAANIALGMEFHGWKQTTIDKTVRKYLDIIDLVDFADQKPAQLSGGMKQRVALARTLAFNPKLLLLDEPLASLDIVGRKYMAQMVKDYIRAQKAAALIVTHSAEEAVFLADRILILSPRPAKIVKEFRISDKKKKNTLSRTEAFQPVMDALIKIYDEEKKRA